MKAVIFDMDGVIIDSEPLHFMVDKKVLQELKIKTPQNYLDRFVGFTNPAMWKVIKKDYDIKLSIEELIDKQITDKLKYLNENEFSPIEGITELLEALSTKNYKIGIASSSPRVFIEAVIKKLKIKEYFEVIASGEEVPNSKPNPDVFIAAAKELQVESKNCLVIEDSKNGVIAAKEAGMTCIGFKNINSGNQDLSLADTVVKSIKDIDCDKMTPF